MTLDYHAAIIPQDVRDLPRYLDEELGRLSRAMSTDENDLAPLYVVYKGGVVYGALGEEEGMVTLVGAVTDNQGNVTGYRPVAVRGTLWSMKCSQWQVPGMQMPPNANGYNLEIAPDGVTVIATPLPDPNQSWILPDSNDYDLSAQDNTWVKLTGDLLIDAVIPAGSAVLSYRARYHERSDRGGIVETAFGLDGAAPAFSVRDDTLGSGEIVVATGGSEITAGVASGTTVALWARCINNNPQSDIWCEGSVTETYIKVEER